MEDDDGEVKPLLVALMLRGVLTSELPPWGHERQLENTASRCS